MKVKEITISVAQARELQAKGVALNVATLYQTMGPHWKDIVWVQNPKPGSPRQCFVSKTHTHDQITALLA